LKKRIKFRLTEIGEIMKEELMLFAGKAIIIAITVLIVLFIIDDVRINWLRGNFF